MNEEDIEYYHLNEDDIPQDFKYAAIQYELDHIKAQFEKNEELSNRVKRILDNYTSKIYESLGSKKDEFLEFYKKKREVARTMRPQFTATPEGEKIEKEFYQKRFAEGNEFMKNLGTKVNDIKSIREKYQEEFGSVIKEFFPEPVKTRLKGQDS
jgi:hypothetical protein